MSNCGKSKDECRDGQGAGEHQLEACTASEDDYDSIATALQEVIAKEAQSQVVHAL